LSWKQQCPKKKVHFGHDCITLPSATRLCGLPRRVNFGRLVNQTDQQEEVESKRTKRSACVCTMPGADSHASHILQATASGALSILRLSFPQRGISRPTQARSNLFGMRVFAWEKGAGESSDLDAEKIHRQQLADYTA